MADRFFELPGLISVLDKVVYQPAMETPPDRPYCFVYFVTIRNESEHTLTIRGRKWVVTNAQGRVTVVEGEGVVGKIPLLAPGEEFSYNSFHLLDTRSGQAEGRFFGVDDEGRPVLTRLETFEMRVPGED